jgi:hypothetical protein
LRHPLFSVELPAVKKRLLIVLAIPLLMFLPMILSRQSPQAKAVRHIQEQYWNAERPVLRPGSGTREVEKFLGDLKAIDTLAAPNEIQDAMVRLTVAVEAKRELVNLFDRKRGNAY